MTLKGCIIQTSKAMKNQRQIPFQWLNLSRWTYLFKTREDLAKDTIGCKVEASQKENMVNGGTIALNHRNRYLLLPPQIKKKKLSYLLNSCLAWREILVGNGGSYIVVHY